MVLFADIPRVPPRLLTLTRTFLQMLLAKEDELPSASLQKLSSAAEFYHHKANNAKAFIHPLETSIFNHILTINHRRLQRDMVQDLRVCLNLALDPGLPEASRGRAGRCPGEPSPLILRMHTQPHEGAMAGGQAPAEGRKGRGKGGAAAMRVVTFLR